MKAYERRDILRLLTVSGVSFGSGLWCCASHAPSGVAPAPVLAGSNSAAPPAEDFFFLQLSDTHWGFSGAANPEADHTLRATIATINAVATRPDFVIFTGDLTHTTDDPAVRRARMQEFKTIVAGLDVKTVRFIPGEHDAALDAGAAYREHFGEMHYAFQHKGVYFIALDNVSDPGSLLGETQLAWLRSEVSKAPKDAPLVVFAHRPLFDLFPAWEWSTPDGKQAIDLLQAHPNVTVFYGHIHQAHHQQTGSVNHLAARSLIFPLPAPGSVPKKAALPWDPQSSDHGLGYRQVSHHAESFQVEERPFVES